MLQSIFTKEFTPPQMLLLSEENIVVFPTDQKYSNEDYEAVIISRKFLHIWGGDTWPDNSFTPDDNYNDLAYHVEDNNTHRAYGYMIFSADKKTCLGSLYVNPLALWPNYHDLVEGRDPREEFHARIDYWLRSDQPELETLLVPIMKTWFKDVWKINPLLVSKPGFDERNDLFKKMGLIPVASFSSKEENKQMTMYKLL